MKLFILSLLLLLTACGGKSGRGKDSSFYNISANNSFFKEFGKVKPYRQSGISASTLVKCVYATERQDSCPVSKLSLLNSDLLGNVSIDSILDRTLVSHKFLGQNFEAALRKINGQYLWKLFGAINAIVISDRINPSFYSSISGTIYISGRYLWTSKDQKGMVTQAIDSRGSSLADATMSKLMFESASRQVIDRESILSSSYEENRTIDDLVPALFRLLIHELTHANDYLPPGVRNNLEINKPIGQISGKRYLDYDLISDGLRTPPQDETVKNYVRTFYDNLSPSQKLLQLTAKEIAEKFSQDFASEMYGYYTSNEDLALLIEDLISLLEMDIERVQGIISYPSINFVVSEEYPLPLVWGEKNRILKPEILNRALDAAEKILESFDADSIRASIRDHSRSNANPNEPWKDFASRN